MFKRCLLLRFKLIWGYADGLTSDTTRKQTKNKYLQTLSEVKPILVSGPMNVIKSVKGKRYSAFGLNGAIDLGIVRIFRFSKT